MVTSLGFQPRLRFPLFVYDAVSKFFFRGSHREVLQRNFHQNFTPGVAEQPMQDDQGQQRTLGEVWMDVWLREYDDWFASDNKYAVASQIQLCLKHKTTKEMQRALCISPVPIMTYVALQDKTIPVRDQLKMTKRLGAQSHEAKVCSKRDGTLRSASTAVK
ncbi:hypothetical protein WJX84_001027 [Apatococcus fuscideae]|uniref:Uncharacterized protein n=1 Tax=Apatococcus fuscideae TaxID=2026836 RepID=A0AAW1TCQ5_9CHLO